MTYLRARYYNPSIRRFVQEDPTRDLLDWYVYCNNNPINKIDPSGLSGIMKDGSYYITHKLDKKLLKLKQKYATATPKEKRKIAIKAGKIRRSGKEGVDWSVRADKPLEYYIIDTDVTNKLNGLMKQAANENEWKRFGALTQSTNIIRYVDFALMVRPGGKYDLKSQPEWQGKEHYIYEGTIIWYDDPGNILYGYLGKAMGFSDAVLYTAAGAVQIATKTSSWEYVKTFLMILEIKQV